MVIDFRITSPRTSLSRTSAGDIAAVEKRQIPLADLMIDAYWSAGGRVAHEGQSVYSHPGGGTHVGEDIVGRLDADGAAADPRCIA